MELRAISFASPLSMSVSDDGGQMAVECAATLPVMLAVAFIVVNALVFLGDCVAFDIAFREAACLQADDGFDASSDASVRSEVERRMGRDRLEILVSSERMGTGHVRYEGTLTFSPPFLAGVSVFGATVPPLSHKAVFTVSPYRKGVIA